MIQYMSVALAAKKFRISARRVQMLCEQGRLEGAYLNNGVWQIPTTTKKPIDRRTKEGRDSIQLSFIDQPAVEDSTVTLSEVSKLLSVSEATVRNWVKLGKITPTKNAKFGLRFSIDHIQEVLNTISNPNTNSLKMRRNKTHATGVTMYSNYIHGDDNLSSITKLLTTIPSMLTEQQMRVLLANAVIQLSTEDLSTTHTIAIESFLSGETSPKLPKQLIFDLLGPANNLRSYICDLKSALRVKFTPSADDDILGLIYMSLLNLSSKKAFGTYYTPAKIVDHFINILEHSVNLRNKKCIDPCCGSGNFLLRLAERTQNLSCIFGQDIDEIAVQIARINFALRYEDCDISYFYDHFTVGDSLHKLPFEHYDIVLGNPPWGYVFSENETALLRSKFPISTGTRLESFELFLERGVDITQNNGVLAYVLPESILNVAAHKPIRDMLVSMGAISFVSYIGNMFSGVQCPAIILGIKKNSEERTIQVYTDNQSFTISGERLKDSEYLNLKSTEEEYTLLSKIGNKDFASFLKDNATFALGIVTGDNKSKISDTPKKGYEKILRGSDIGKFCIRNCNSFISYEPETFQQVAPTEIYRAKEKLVYRFISETPILAYDNAQTLTLNSCNVLIPTIPGVSIKYVMAILNSSVISYYYRHVFQSKKILRSHLEALPIRIASTTVQQEIVMLVDRILNEGSSCEKLKAELDNHIYKLYQLSENEIDLIRTEKMSN